MNFGKHKSVDPNPLSPVCTFCSYFDISNPGAKKCQAFPSGIPEEIWSGRNGHTAPYPGDKGVQFERFEVAKAA